MAFALTAGELVQHLRKHYSDEALLVVDLWSSEDVEVQIADLDSDNPEEAIDRSMDIWSEIADKFVSGFENTTSQLNDYLMELIEDES
jgi:hypothetical protein